MKKYVKKNIVSVALSSWFIVITIIAIITKNW
jgi:hypothetical protein